MTRILLSLLTLAFGLVFSLFIVPIAAVVGCAPHQVLLAAGALLLLPLLGAGPGRELAELRRQRGRTDVVRHVLFALVWILLAIFVADPVLVLSYALFAQALTLFADTVAAPTAIQLWRDQRIRQGHPA
ncbi:hypothetical protein [Brevundimonas nasdae]|uniref:hypothetical protein n=1 Tax=Brevundimonas nasdae TaxID=172043 RepID=UPI003F68CC5A